jgi:hypothetical protein
MKMPAARATSIAGIILILALSGRVLNFAASPAHARGEGRAAIIAGCPLYPASNIWNRDIASLPLQRNSASFIDSIGLSGHLHADFGSGLYAGAPIGIPYIVVPGGQRGVAVRFNYAGESDPGPYPLPANAPIEGGARSSGDRHVIVVKSGTCRLYELYDGRPQADGSWSAGSGASWNLTSNALRPASWTSADAAGLPILPGLVRYDEVASGVINHALRFTVASTQKSFLWPARHQASSSADPNLPPMGLRLRLKASFDISSYTPTNRVILTALKHYGMFVADNGSSWFISGAPDNRWNNDDLHALGNVPGSAFEAVDESSLEISPASAQAAGSVAPAPARGRVPRKAASRAHMPAPNRAIDLVPLPTATPLIARETESAGNYRARRDPFSSVPLVLAAAGVLLAALAGIIVAGAALLRARRGMSQRRL